ncbi:MAG TPA: hypothetical protein VJ999_12930 [Candidatus Sulfotelmatobacter sp.]|nr:hypothetical protein [Candidatus Sulfotelmatobacter sp.]
MDQPFVHAFSNAGKDIVCIGLNDLGVAGGQTATIDRALDGNAAPPAFVSVRIETRSTGTAGQNGPQIRPASAADGTAYAAFYGWRSFDRNSGSVTADVVVVRDDPGGGAAPFTALLDSSDNLAGQRVALNVQFVWNGTMGNQRTGGDIAIAVDPNNSQRVYVAWADEQSSVYTLHLRCSNNGGQVWSANDIQTMANATNPALAINANGVLAFAYQHVTGTGAAQRWVTQVDQTSDDATWTPLVLATVPAGNPQPQFQPYIGDYIRMISVGADFYGVFSANNLPDQNNFPNQVKYQRNADFNAGTLLATDRSTPVNVSIDPFFFKITA